MEITLNRTYLENATHGALYNSKGQIICPTIELPWKENQSKISCIPEGRYQVTTRYSKKFKWHLLINEVPDRQLILMHPANDAQKELKGCIGPVGLIVAEGQGINSVYAFGKVCAEVWSAFNRNEKVFITIQKEINSPTH
jgi:Family of unknown function (DUF5675)